MGSEFFSRNSRRAQQRPTTCPTTYVFNPYSEVTSFDVVGKSPANVQTQAREVAKKLLPTGTSRLDLFGQVHFIPFPDHVMDRTRQRSEAPPLEDRADTLVQLFFGQLPYKVADNMIIWLCEHLAESDVLFIERVMQDKSRKGCMQVFVDEEAAEYIITALNKRVLFDVTGIWHAQNETQLAALEKHCCQETNRFKGLPFRMMVAERSTSTYVRRQKQPSVSARRSRSATPPPMPIEDEFLELAVDGSIAEEPEQCMCAQCLNPAPYSSFCDPSIYSYPPIAYAEYYYADPYYYSDAPMMPTIYGAY